ncbi:hypothetical protein Bca4012_050678 [Brassica carinata]|uniref:Replication factor A C-terminal domain-containing protein n=1 Tax=Brassica carinata TaxID=52824 RepID=A0A8X7R553_BRACI|nr:hypothetical protein Bca52824_053375 [Brassica carinata]
MVMKRNEKSPASSDSDEKVMFFKDASLGPHETQLRFRLIHFWEARNPVKKILIGLEMLLIDEQLSVLLDIPIPFDEDRFRFHSYGDFEANCDLKGDLYDVVGHMKLVDGQTLTERLTLDEAKIATTRHVMVHVQTHEGPVMKLYLWDQAATDFCKKFKSYKNTPTVLLVTAVNTKRLGGNHLSLWFHVFTDHCTLALSSMSPTRDAFFECTATIDDVVHGSAWYYIACTECHSKATKGANSLICTNTRCVKDNTSGVAQYRAKISVYDCSEQAFLSCLANKNKGPGHEVPVPESLISTIRQTHKFCVKFTDHNFSGNTRAITVTKILPLDTPSPTEASLGNAIAETSEEAMQTGSDVCEASKSRGDSADEESKRTFDSVDPEKVKRARCEN